VPRLKRSANALFTIILAVTGILMPDAAAQNKPAAMGKRRNSPLDEGKRVEARNGVVTSANALASDAGLEILRSGGNAVDAAVAMAFAIGVVEPQMSGMGGGGAATVWMKRQRHAAYLDFYAAQFADSWRGHTSPPPQPGQASPAKDPRDLSIVGIPGNVAGLLALHEKFGVLPRERVMAPAIRLAEDGFPVGDVLSGFIVETAAKLKPFPAASEIFMPGGKALPPGSTLRNPELAKSLGRVARDGRDGFYGGPIADAIVQMLNAGQHPATVADLDAYQPRWKRPLCADYRGRAVLSAAPPQTGFQVLHTLELLEPVDLRALGLPTQSASAFATLVSALRVGQAAATTNNDPNWALVPANGIASSAFAAERRSLVGTGMPPATIENLSALAFDNAPPAGECVFYDPYGPSPAIPAAAASLLLSEKPGYAEAQSLKSSPERQVRPSYGEGLQDAFGNRNDEPGSETTHISVVDRDGNAVALTQTNSTVFGSGAFVTGFFLNDSGFRFTDANVDAPSLSRWRVRTTTIAPTIVLKGGEVQMVVGAPGSGRIPTEIVQVMVYTLDYGLDPLDAVRMPRIFPSARNTSVQVEHGFPPELLRAVRSLGYDPVRAGAEYARLYLIVRRGKSWIGVADTRHDGQARGY
jgi:gamma-glutamyltranspeptidase / glutathione hydrolase